MTTHLSSDGPAGLAGRRRLEDALLLLRRQRGVERDDLDVAHVAAQVVHLALDALAGLVNLLGNGGGKRRG